MRPEHRPAIAGIALLELLVSAAIVGVVGAIIAAALHSAFVLFAKNIAVNTPHQEARIAVARLAADLHSSVSPAQLVNSEREPLAGAGPAAGISFQRLVGSPCVITQDSAVGSQNIVINAGSLVITPGQRFVIPSHRIEDDIISVTGSGAATTVRVANPIATAISVPTTPTASNTSGPNAIVGHVTQRAGYVVVSGELRLHPLLASGAHTVLARNVTSPMPFLLPATSGGTASLRSTASIDLATSDPRSSNRSYQSSNMLLNSVVAQRNRLTIYQ